MLRRQVRLLVHGAGDSRLPLVVFGTMELAILATLIGNYERCIGM